MERCKTCKWWDSTDGEWGECDLATVWYDPEDPKHPESRALAEADGWEKDAAFLRTHAEFGCVQHEPAGGT